MVFLKCFQRQLVVDRYELVKEAYQRRHQIFLPPSLPAAPGPSIGSIFNRHVSLCPSGSLVPGKRSRNLPVTLENKYWNHVARKIFVQAGKWTNCWAGEDLAANRTGLGKGCSLSTPARAAGWWEATGASSAVVEANSLLTFWNEAKRLGEGGPEMISLTPNWRRNNQLIDVFLRCSNPIELLLQQNQDFTFFFLWHWDSNLWTLPQVLPSSILEPCKSQNKVVA